MQPIIQTEAWKTLEEHKLDLSRLHLNELFSHDKQRFERFSVEGEGFLLDFSKNRMTQTTLQLLLQLAEQANLAPQIEAMFSGKKINATEKRAALHTALRNRENTPVLVDSEDVMPEINAVLARMRELSEKVRNSDWQGFSGKAITDIVNLGIGGSDLGPKMVVQALENYADKHLRCHFVSNVDPTAIARTLKQCNPETTLFIIASKSFSTQETISNAEAAKAWLLKHTQQAELSKHFIAISSQVEKAVNWGVGQENIFPLWDFVGGRYSLWSAIGLSIAIMCGMDCFEELLRGAHAMDLHFRNTEFKNNLPVLLGLVGIWNHNFLHMPSNAILPYSESLKYFGDYLQQAEMESNGKSVDFNSRKISEYQTAPVVWGSVGTNGQHSFHQLLHQGTARVWCDFILPLKPQDDIANQHELLMANCFAQSQALMQGKSEEQAYTELKKQGCTHDKAAILAPHKTVVGNKSSNTILFEKVDAFNLGKLIALYEHKIFVQSIIWQINAFDQWGVELGKQLAETILPDLTGDVVSGEHDCSTRGLIDYIKNH